MSVPIKQHLASPPGRGNHGNCATAQPPGPVTLIEFVEWITLTTYLSLRPFYSGVGGWDNRSCRSCTRDSARQPRDANVPNGSLGYDVYPANGTRDGTSQLFSPVPSQRLCNGKSSGSYTIFQIIMQITFYKIFRWQIFVFSKTNKTFTAIAFYYDQPLVLI